MIVDSDNKKELINKKSELAIVFVQGLVSGDETMVNELLTMKYVDQEEKCLIDLIAIAWKSITGATENKSTDKEILRLFSKITTSRKRVIASLVMTLMYLHLGHKELSRQYVNSSRILAASINKSELAEIVTLVGIHVDIEFSTNSKLIQNSLLIFTATTKFTQAYKDYLRGSLRRYSSVSDKVCQEYLRLAIVGFNQLNYLYLVALAQMELAQCDITQDESRKLLFESSQILKSLDAKSDTKLCSILISKLSDSILEGNQIGEIIYLSDLMAQVKVDILKAASCDYPVLITGETGTGKELVAQAIYQYSDRKDKPFIVVNCGAIPKDLVDSEIFGSKKGSFTGADRDKKGFVGESEGGTLFLDEIGELDRELQSKLFRFIENSDYHRIGSGKSQKANVRVIAATNRDVKELAEKDKKGEPSIFRHELINRFTLNIELPPLSKRREDILPIAQAVLKKENSSNLTLGGQVKAHLLQRKYLYNVRELRQIVRNAILEARTRQSETITMDMIEKEKHQINAEGFKIDCNTLVHKEAMINCEKSFLHYVFELCRKDIKMVSELTHISIPNLYKLKKRYGL